MARVMTMSSGFFCVLEETFRSACCPAGLRGASATHMAAKPPLLVPLGLRWLSMVLSLSVAIVDVCVLINVMLEG